MLSRSVPKQFELLLLKIHLSRNKSLTVAACYRPPSDPSCALDTICELFAPHLSSEFVLLGDRNWDMLDTPAILQSKLDALNLTQIIKDPTRYNPKSVNMGTLIDIILTNLPSKYTSAVFNQDLSDHCLHPLWVRDQTTTPHHCQTLPKTLLRAGLSNQPGPGILECLVIL